MLESRTPCVDVADVADFSLSLVVLSVLAPRSLCSHFLTLPTSSRFPRHTFTLAADSLTQLGHHTCSHHTSHVTPPHTRAPQVQSEAKRTELAAVLGLSAEEAVESGSATEAVGAGKRVDDDAIF